MKVRIQEVPGVAEPEVLIRCGQADGDVRRLAAFAKELGAAEPIPLYQGNQAFYFPLETLLFFETEGDAVYAHTAGEAFRCKYRLYELEALLPRYFIRASKSAILNLRQVYAIDVNLAASSLVRFQNSHKRVYVSRRYYKALRQRLQERSYL